jgi:hypothetical protein
VFAFSKISTKLPRTVLQYLLKVKLKQLARKAEKRDLATHEPHAKPCFKKMKKRGWKRRARRIRISMVTNLR